MTTVLLDAVAVADIRRWLATDDAAITNATMVLDLLSEALRHVAAWFDTAAPEHPRSPWRLMSLGDEDLAPDVVIHLRVADGGDQLVLVDRALIVVHVRFEVQS